MLVYPTAKDNPDESSNVTAGLIDDITFNDTNAAWFFLKSCYNSHEIGCVE